MALCPSSSSSSSQKTWTIHRILAGTAIAAAIGARAYLSRSMKLWSWVVGIIPARYASSRFEGKRLVKIPRQSHDPENLGEAKLAPTLDHVGNLAQISILSAVPTDDESMADCCRGFGANVIMT